MLGTSCLAQVRCRCQLLPLVLSTILILVLGICDMLLQGLLQLLILLHQREFWDSSEEFLTVCWLQNWVPLLPFDCCEMLAHVD